MCTRFDAFFFSSTFQDRPKISEEGKAHSIDKVGRRILLSYSSVYCTYLQSYQQLVSSCLYILMFLFLYNEYHLNFTIITITIAYVQLTSLFKLPFAWLFHLYSIFSCLNNIPLSIFHSHSLDIKWQTLNGCVDGVAVNLQAYMYFTIHKSRQKHFYYDRKSPTEFFGQIE